MTRQGCDPTFNPIFAKPLLPSTVNTRQQTIWPDLYIPSLRFLIKDLCVPTGTRTQGPYINLLHYVTIARINLL